MADTENKLDSDLESGSNLKENKLTEASSARTSEQNSQTSAEINDDIITSQKPIPLIKIDAKTPSSAIERYEVYPSLPLPEYDSGIAKAFTAIDKMQPDLLLFCLICYPNIPIRLDELRKLSGKSVGHNILVENYGNLDWPLHEQQCLGIIFQRPTGQSIDKYFKSEEFSDQEKLEKAKLILLSSISALRNLNKLGITHRSIRPSNVFFSDSNGEDIIFGECVTTPPGFSQSLELETIERGIADEGSRGNGDVSDDIYAVAATISILLQNTGSFPTFASEQISFNKIIKGSFNILVGERLKSQKISKVLEGMLQDKIEERWNLNDIELWLGGETITPRVYEKETRASQGLTFDGIEYFTKSTLAYSMSQNRSKAVEIIKSGALTKWSEKSLKDKVLASKISQVTDDTTVQKDRAKYADELLLSKILIVMCPTYPISYKNILYTSDGFGSGLAIELLRGGDAKTYTESVSLGLLNFSFQLNSNDKIKNEDRIEITNQINRYLQKAGPGFGVERCLYELNPGCPCQSPIIIKENIFFSSMLLPTLDKIAGTTNTQKSPIDRHIAAFIASKINDDLEQYLSEIGDFDKSIQTLGMLKLLVHIQKNLSSTHLLGLAKWVGGLMAPAIRIYNSRKLRKDIESGIPQIIRNGNLGELLKLIDDPSHKEEDQLGYQTAMNEFKEAEETILKTETNSDPESEVAVKTSRQAASVLSILIMIFISSLILLAN